MNYSNKFLFSMMENNYLNFRGLQLTNNDLDECISIFKTAMERGLIKNIKLYDNKLNHYKSSDILKIFPCVRNIYTSHIDDIDVNTEFPVLNIIVK